MAAAARAALSRAFRRPLPEIGVLTFIYIPGFYAAVEQADDVELRGRPVVVGGDPEKGGAVTSASREAREAGIDPAMGLVRALELCPELRLRPTRLPRYREASAELRATAT